jgi:hypothetical protein
MTLRRRTVPAARVFAVTCLIAVPWVAGAVMGVAAVDAAGKLFWFKFQGAWQLPVITALTCFVLEYAWPGRWLTRRNLILLSIPPLLVAMMVLFLVLSRLMVKDRVGFDEGQQDRKIPSQADSNRVSQPCELPGIRMVTLKFWCWIRVCKACHGVKSIFSRNSSA